MPKRRCCKKKSVVNIYITGRLIDLSALAKELSLEVSSQRVTESQPTYTPPSQKESYVVPLEIEQAKELYEKLGGESQQVLAILAIAKFLRESEESCIRD